MDKKEKLLLAMSMSAIILSGCTTSNTGGGPYRVGQSAQNQGLDTGVSGTGVTHTHNGVAHTHRLPEGGLKHSHNIGTGSTNQQTCQPCGNRTNTVTTSTNTNTGGNCHMHAGRRHCHALPSTGTNHQHNMGGGTTSTSATTSTNTYVNRQPAYVAPVPVPAPTIVNTPPVNSSTYYDYTNTNAAPAAPVAPAAPAVPTSNYYDPAPASKGAVPHQHNGQYHSHLLPASGVNHTHNGGTSFGGAYSSSPNASGSSSYYNGGESSSSSSSNSAYSYSEASSGSCDTASGNYYIVKPKDGVYRIGVNHGVKRDDIIRLNNLQMPDYVITPGQCLRLR